MNRISLTPERYDAGFTLLELLVAMTLLGFLSVLLFGGLKLGTRVWERSQTVTADTNRVRAVQLALAGELRATYPLFRRLDATHAAVEFDGRAHAMTFLSASGNGSGAMKRIDLAIRDAETGAVIVETDMDELAVSSGPARTLLGQLKTMTFTYFGEEKGDKAASWHDEWRDQARLPQLVRVRAELRDRTLVWPDLVVAPRIGADQGCTIDPLTRFCQGRS